MSKLTELKSLIAEYQAAEVTAGALQDISALRMQAIRRAFDKNRAFYQEIRALYRIVQSQAKRRRNAIESKKRGRGTGSGAPGAARGRRSRELFVALTSNKRFYGALMRDIVAKLAEELRAAPGAGAIVIGRVGGQYFEELGAQSALGKRVRQTAFADDTPSAAELRDLQKTLDAYDRIVVLYPKFINPFRQEVGEEDITQSLAADGAPDAEGPVSGETGYIFEPEVPDILSFFDTQVRRVLLGRVLLEAELSRTSARLMHMGEAQERAKNLAEAAEGRVRREMASISNTELLETFAGFTKWNHE